MTAKFIKLTPINANDDDAVLTKWLINDLTFVKVGQPIAIFETTKSAFEMESLFEGYCKHLASEGDTLKNDSEVAAILDNVNDEVLISDKKIPASAERKWTKKAELVAKKMGLDISEIAEKLGRIVTESDVIGGDIDTNSIKDLADDRYPSNKQERILLIGGGGGGGAITLDVINRCNHQRAVGILDNNLALVGKKMIGVPVLGSNSMASELYNDGFFDSAIIVVTANIKERREIFDDLISKNIPLANVIDPSATLRSHVSMGAGNLIMPNCFFATAVSIGNNNFFASGVSIEHHSTVGNNCTFGPRVSTAGAVTIFDNIKLGMGVLIEPYLTIGNNSLISSGVIVTNSIPENSIAKSSPNFVIKKNF